MPIKGVMRSCKFEGQTLMAKRKKDKQGSTKTYKRKIQDRATQPHLKPWGEFRFSRETGDLIYWG